MQQHCSKLFPEQSIRFGSHRAVEELCPHRQLVAIALCRRCRRVLVSQHAQSTCAARRSQRPGSDSWVMRDRFFLAAHPPSCQELVRTPLIFENPSNPPIGATSPNTLFIRGQRTCALLARYCPSCERTLRSGVLEI